MIGGGLLSVITIKSRLVTYSCFWLIIWPALLLFSAPPYQIYDPKSNCNEVHSADRYKIFSQEIGQPHDERDAVVEYILATKDHPINRLGEYIDDNLKIVTDLDLAILGRQPDQYMDYAAHVRMSYWFTYT